MRDNTIIIFNCSRPLKQCNVFLNEIAGLDMSYENYKNLCKEAGKEKCDYLLLNRLDDEEK